MNTASKAARTAKASRVLGILSMVILGIAGSILVYVRLFLDTSDWVSGIGYVVFALLLFLVTLILGLSACITALIALKRNKEGGGDPAIRKIANLGLGLGLASIVIVLGIYATAWILSPNTPPPDISTPMPSTTVP
jgi:hypothetical protein